MSPAEAAGQLVRERFPHARAAWLGGSSASGNATATSDLDVTVLLAGPPAPYRESLHHGDRPVELFVQTEETLEFFRAEERARRRPTTLRLIAQSHILVDGDGSGVRLRDSCARLLAAGPDPLTEAEVRAARYRSTDLLDDLLGSPDADERLAIAATLWRATADLLVTGHGRWTGDGKWLHREMVALDRDAGTDHAGALGRGVRCVASGDIAPMATAVLRVLDLFGGRLFDGFRVAGPA